MQCDHHPLMALVLFLLVMLGRYGQSYDGIVQNVTLVNEYNIHFKEDMDSVMYQMVARSLGKDEVEDVIGMENPETMIEDASASFLKLESSSTSDQASQVSTHVLKLLETLRKYVREIDSEVKVTGSYEANMVKLDTDIRIITELIQERIAEYLSYETVSMEQVRQAMVASRMNPDPRCRDLSSGDHCGRQPSCDADHPKHYPPDPDPVRRGRADRPGSF